MAASGDIASAVPHHKAVTRRLCEPGAVRFERYSAMSLPSLSLHRFVTLRWSKKREDAS